MKIRLLALVLSFGCVLTGAFANAASSAPAATTQSSSAAALPAPPAPPAPSAVDGQESSRGKASVRLRIDTDADDDAEADTDDDATVRLRVRRQGNAVVSMARDAELAAGRTADSVVAIGANANSAGTVSDAVVAIGGNARATGPVGDSVVAILGDAYLNAPARTVVAVLGNVELGPEARVSKEVVTIGGAITRDPAAVVSGGEQSIAFGHFVASDGLRAWLRQCVLLGRPLAFDSRVGWAWGVSLGFLALYALMALIFRDAITRCVTTMETMPGRSLLAALLTVAVTPVVVVLLVVTVIGIVLLPFLGLGLLAASLFGKAVMLTWVGRRVVRSEQPVIPLLIGGAIVLLLYVVPVLGIVVYKLLGLVGLGVVLYTLLLALRPPKSPGAAAAVDGAAAAGFASATPASGAETPYGADAAATPGAAGATEAPRPTAASVAPRPVDFTALPRAGFWARMGALALDAVLILVVVQMVSDAGMRAVLALLALYAAIMWQLKGTTIGGSIVGLKLVRTDGRPIDWATAIVRALGCLLSLAIAGLGFLWIVFDDERQAWHDKIAGTAVVRVPKGISLL